MFLMSLPLVIVLGVEKNLTEVVVFHPDGYREAQTKGLSRGNFGVQFKKLFNNPHF